MIHDQLTLVVNFVLVLPLFFFLPGYVLTRTFLKISLIHFTEQLFLRVLLSVVLSSVLLLGCALFGVFTAQNLVFSIVIVSFLMFLPRRFRFQISLMKRPLVWKDFCVLIIFLAALFFMMWPSERVGFTFTQAAQLVREGTLHVKTFSPECLVREGGLACVWLAWANCFFGLKLSLLISPVFGVLSMGALFLLADRMFGRLGAMGVTFFLLTNFTNLWFCRLPEGFSLAQALVIGSFYLISLVSQQNDKRFWILAFISFILASMTKTGLGSLLILGAVGFVLDGMAVNSRLKILEKLILSFALIGILWIGLRTNTFSQLMNFFSLPLLFLVVGGVLIFFLKEMKQEFSGLMILLLFYPIFEMFQPLTKSNSLIAMGPWIPSLIPIFSLWVGGLLGMVSRLGKLAKMVAIVGIIILSGINLYSFKDVLWLRDGAGILNFYDGVRKGFLKNALILSDDEKIVSVLKGVYGSEIYWTGSEYLDVDLKLEMQRWLKEGGQVYFFSFQKTPLLEGFDLKLDSVESFRTLVIDENAFPPEKKKIIQSHIQVYQAKPLSLDDLK